MDKQAYLVFHDGFDSSMEVWHVVNFDRAKELAKERQEILDQSGYENCGVWRAYEKLPKCPIWKFRTNILA